ncbi:hypothetical protein DL96DRAFT_1716839 [Flagelloscypha sp. PMI_526]|nr:hypothetical protein DL96DRAFT_1716839 [Flagelloscypha sp. PMI_526]
MSPPFSTNVSRDLAIHYQTTYVTSQTYRSLFFDEDWLRKAYERCSWGIEAVEEAISRSQWYVTLEDERRLEDMRFVRDVLNGLLALPFVPFPMFSTDILLEIMKLSALCHRRPLSLTLVSLPIQHYVDPILWSTSNIGDFSPFLWDLNFKPENFIPRSWSFDEKSRVQKCRTYVRTVRIKIKVQPHTLSNLSTLFPNIRQVLLD